MQVAVLTQRIAALAQDKEAVELKLEAVSCQASDERMSLLARAERSEEALKQAEELLASESLLWHDRLAKLVYIV